MKTVFFGVGFQFDDGTRPGVAINRNGTVVEATRTMRDTRSTRVRERSDLATVKWNDTGSKRKSYSGGTDPACALNAQNVILEAHSEDKNLHSMVGVISGTSIGWGSASTFEKTASSRAWP